MSGLSNSIEMRATPVETPLLSWEGRMQGDRRLQIRGIIYEISQNVFRNINQEHGRLLRNKAPKNWVKIEYTVDRPEEIQSEQEQKELRLQVQTTVKKALVSKYPDLSIIGSALSNDSSFFLVDFSARKAQRNSCFGWFCC
jgi:hypothetical protein